MSKIKYFLKDIILNFKECGYIFFFIDYKNELIIDCCFDW